MGAELFPDFALCLPLLIFPYGDHISRARWQGAVDHTPRLQVPPLGTSSYYFLYSSSYTLQKFCHLSEVLLCAHGTQRL